MNILVFTLIFLVLDLVMNLLSLKVTKLLGIDFLFFASWLAGINYGIFPGIIVSLLLLAEHTILHLNKSKYIGFSLPSQLSAVLLGYFLGQGGFIISLIIYQVINTLLMVFIGGFGIFFFIFLVVNTIFNLFVHFIWLKIA
jgi:hypothetical protein